MASRKNGFLLYKQQWDAISDLDDKYLGQLFRALFQYQISGIEPENHCIIYRDFKHFKSQFLLDDVKYQGVVDKNIENGKKGGRPKKPSGLEETQLNPKNPVGFLKPKKADKEKDKDKDIIIPPTPLNGVSGETPKTPKARRAKATKTRKECETFYESEIASIPLEENFPADLLAAARKRRIQYTSFGEYYRQLWLYMSQPSTAWPNGLWGHVLARENQLTYLQYCHLVLVEGMGSADIKEYLTQWENKRYDHSNIYATLQKWWRDRNKPRNGSGPKEENKSGGLEAPDATFRQ